MDEWDMTLRFTVPRPSANLTIPTVLNRFNCKDMVRGNFIGATIVAIIYTVYILARPLPTKAQTALVLVILNALIIVLMSFAFKK
jgi:hypothetical protein